jgi:hypothetical protein
MANLDSLNTDKPAAMSRKGSPRGGFGPNREATVGPVIFEEATSKETKGKGDKGS